jgi:hypothetical protein
MWDKCCQDTFSIHQNLCGWTHISSK